MESFQNYLISLTSANAQNSQGQYGGNITFPVNSVSMNGIQAFRVKQAIVELSYFNVTSVATDNGRGWLLSLDWVGNVTGAFTTLITAGSYSIDELCLQIAAQVLTTSGNTVTVTYSNPTQIITITRTAGPDATLTVNPTGTNIGWIRLGFPASLGPAATLTATNAYWLNVTQSARVHCLTWANPNTTASVATAGNVGAGVQRSMVVCSVPMAEVNSWESCVMKIPTEWFQVQDSFVSSLVFRLCDDQDRDLQLTRSYWSIDLEVRAAKA